MQKIKVYHFHNGSGGGVLSVIKNLLRYSTNPLIENHVIYTINKEQVQNFTLNYLEGAVTETVFYYSPKWNFYHTCRQLAKFVPDDHALLIAHDWLELGMVSLLGLQNKVIQFVHGDYDYYYQLSKRHSKCVDAYIPVAQSISDQLLQQLPARKNDIHYLRFPVPEIDCSLDLKKEAAIIFVGRCTKDKGYHLLPGIAAALQQKGLQFHWHIVGTLDESEKNEYPWNPSVVVTFYGNISQQEVNSLLCKMKVIILPSIAEGMPLSLIEAMKAGVLPLVNDLPGGIQELVINETTGFKIAENQPSGYINQIMKLAANNNAVEAIQKHAMELSNRLFNPITNTINLDKLFLKVSIEQPKIKKSERIYGSKLDQQWIPNFITTFFRRF